MRLILFFIASLLSLPVLANEAAEWLKGMSQSLMQSNYRGVFVYEMGGRLEAMQITHATRADGEYERLLALTGDPREVIRSPEGVTCILPKRKAVMVDHNMPRTPVPDAFINNLDKIKQHYQLTLEGEDRVSGLDSRVIGVMPLDQYRYGYRLWLTEDNKLPVRLELLQPEGAVLEQMMFTHLTVVDELPDQWLLPELDGSKYEWIGEQNQVSDSEEKDSRWLIEWLPEGFVRTHHNLHAMSSGQSRVEHLVFSDGLATISIYVAGGDTDKPRLKGHSAMGATNALGTEVGQYHVTVVGEVPTVTIEKIAKSVRFAP